MLRKVWKDYKDGFRWSRFKETYHFSMLWLYIYLFCFFPIILDLNEKTERLANYYAAIIPLMFGIYSLAAVPIRLPKQMFLCPLSKEEREKYAKTLFGVRFVMPVLLGSISVMIVVAIGSMDVRLAWIWIAGIVSQMLCGSITTWPGSTWERSDTNRSRLTNPKLKGLYGFSCTGLIASVCLLIMPSVVWDGDITDVVFWVMVGITFGIAFICDIGVIRYFKPVIELTINYETSYDVWSEKQQKMSGKE